MRVLKGLWKLLVGIKDALVLLAMLLFFGTLYALLSARPTTAAPATGALAIEFDGGLVEQPAEVEPLALVGGAVPARDTRLRAVVRALGAAATDPGIKAVVLDLDRFTGGGQATIAEAGVAIDRVRRAGKPVLAFATGYTDDSYQLAAHAGEVWLDPLGAVLVTGPGAQRLYYKGLLDKLGVTTKVYRVGTYKSAVEPFTRTDQSPEARAASQALADALWETWLRDVGRVRPTARIRPYLATLARPDLAGSTGSLAERAHGAGLVDRLGDRVAFGQRVAQIAGAGTSPRPGRYARIALPAWLSAHPAPTGGAIGVLTIAGEIVDGSAAPGRSGGDTISTLLLDELAKKRLKALVVRIDSPGGSVFASEKIRRAIVAAKAQGLPVVVSMASVAASGGYWVATPADRIFADPATITGSIGVFGLLPTFAGSLGKLGLSADGVATTPLSGQPDVYHGTNAAVDALLQGGVEDVYRRFTDLVARARGLSVQRVDQIGQGRVWPGGIARQIGLVDQFGTLGDAIADAARRARLDQRAAVPRYIEREPAVWKTLARDLIDVPEGGGGTDAFTRLAARPDVLLARAVAEAEALASGPAIQVRCLECVGTAAPPQGAGWKRLVRTALGL